jgi:hypothetical protein
MKPDNPIRQAIRESLAALAEKLDEFEQTTHGHIPVGAPIESVGRDLVDAFNDPRPYTTSNLAQSIRALLAEGGSPQLGRAIGVTPAVLKADFQ